jgi:hypothetical protein
MIRPRIASTCHILVNCLTFRESQRQTKQSVSAWTKSISSRETSVTNA